MVSITFMKRLSIFIAFALLVGCVGAAGSELPPSAPELYGFSPAIPDSLPYFTTETDLPEFDHRRTVLVLMSIDESGRVSEARPDDPGDTTLMSYVHSYLKSLTFQPARFADAAEASVLPLLARITPRVKKPEFIFPVNSDYTVEDRDLYMKAITLSGIEPPKVSRFPSYFSTVTQPDSAGTYPFMVFKVSLDSTGRLVDFSDEIIAESKYADQLRSALLYAEFSPALARGKPVAADAYLMISFLPHLSYPSRTWPPAAVDSASLKEQIRVRLIPAKVGLLSKPVPVRHNAFRMASGGQPAYFIGTMCLGFTVDTLGNVAFQHTTIVRREIFEYIRRIVGKWRFYPALDWNGRPVPFYGEMLLDFDTSEFIRIRYLWRDFAPTY